MPNRSLRSMRWPPFLASEKKERRTTVSAGFVPLFFVVLDSRREEGVEAKADEGSSWLDRSSTRSAVERDPHEEERVDDNLF
jgi:hypothetical protein